MSQPAAVQVVIYRECDGYVAQCLNVDVAGEGASARRHLLGTGRRRESSDGVGHQLDEGDDRVVLVPRA